MNIKIKIDPDEIPEEALVRIAALGLLRAHGDHTYMLTEAGREWLRRLLVEDRIQVAA